MKIKDKRYRQLTYFMFALPAVLFVAVFMLYPVLMNVVYSFTDWNGISDAVHFVGLLNYQKILESGELGIVIRNTLLFGILYLPILNAVSLLLACLVKASGRSAGFTRSFFTSRVCLRPRSWVISGVCCMIQTMASSIKYCKA